MIELVAKIIVVALIISYVISAAITIWHSYVLSFDEHKGSTDALYGLFFFGNVVVFSFISLYMGEKTFGIDGWFLSLPGFLIGVIIDLLIYDWADSRKSRVTLSARQHADEEWYEACYKGIHHSHSQEHLDEKQQKLNAREKELYKELMEYYH